MKFDIKQKMQTMFLKTFLLRVCTRNHMENMFNDAGTKCNCIQWNMILYF